MQYHQARRHAGIPVVSIMTQLILMGLIARSFILPAQNVRGIGNNIESGNDK
jgi:hypothetical protein